MKQLSLWARSNPRSTWAVLTISHILAGLNALLLGSILFISDLQVWSWIILVAAHLFMFLFVFYPKKTIVNGTLKYPYIRQKIHDFGLVISCCMVISLGFCHFLRESNPALMQSEEAKAVLIVHNPATSSKGSLFKRLKSTFKEKVTEFKVGITRSIQKAAIKYGVNKKGGSNTAGKVILTLLALCLLAALGVLIAGLSCRLSCSGQEGAAIVVLVLGGGALIWLTIYAIREIWNKRSKQKKVSASP